jgi:hypothetical protein
MGQRLEEPPLTVCVKFNELVGALKALLFYFVRRETKERQENNREKKQYSGLVLTSQRISESTS